MSTNLVGLGIDIHKLKHGRNLILGGVHIPFHLGLDGHSDADILCHAIIDALLGAADEGDIGLIFGVDRPENKDASSLILLQHVGNKLKKDYKIINIDTVIMTEQPKLSQYIGEMKENIAKMLSIEPEQVSIKATTAKGLGDIGTQKAMQAHAIVNLTRKRKWMFKK
ncbi:MAG: 2-C-methyl-D-erythritol 2,4-cyclodiphosphate synthase [Candidatus Firestonebacteria bacterium RIFOXYC2_FULL_39_67]|nr:MAG: 2-C-methyl-D-erythritol 2,4-cyclodiphosphate synthase [Candidatus Firestonebacteria bacterium RIFOXYD2_FULL_39_29]OGF52410.1 MAG: 2-C-methyl-D-erythritol 2,4-cyclodiphosphate synthase [Candidatus Firestonebacteria bacterium RifOxyC12_full_39_7]OGF56793.1 MAG: 2-C-methyl-D-erythritol 2,4-cyclodiphosphate synthase [Candidatus Firestonebacteria bacterium RIFOXYC2_FULL_39_67]